MLGIFLCFTLILNRTTFFSFIPFLDRADIAGIFATFLTTTFILNVRELYFKQMLSIIDKSKRGQFLPYSNSFIAKQYSLACGLTLGVVILLIGFFLAGQPLKVAVSCGGIIFTVLYDMRICVQKGKRLQTFFSNTLILTFVYLLF